MKWFSKNILIVWFFFTFIYIIVDFSILKDSNIGNDFRKSSFVTIIETKSSARLLIETAIPIVNTEKILDILPSFDELKQFSFDQCAVVGNSANLIHSNLGQEIDNHDAVIRINWPLLKNLTKDYGSKTSFMVVGATTWLKNRFTNVSFKDFDEKLIVLNVIRQYDQWLQMLENSKKTSIRQFVFSTHFDKLSSYLINCFNRNCQPSTGFYGVILALHICKNVQLYGFGWESKFGFAPFFKKNSSPRIEGKLFNYGLEYSVYKQISFGNSPQFLKQHINANLFIDKSNLIKAPIIPRNETIHQMSIYDFLIDMETVGLPSNEPPVESKHQRKEKVQIFENVIDKIPTHLKDWKEFKSRIKIDSFKNYQFGKQIGKGGQAAVFFEKSNSSIALKHVKEPEFSYFSEAMILTLLNGKQHVIQLIDMLKIDEKQILVFPYLKAQRPKQVCYGSVKQLKKLITQLFEALCYIHSKGIIHNDLKPNNIIIDPENGELTLVDLGLALIYQTDQQKDFHRGSPKFQAPELLLGSNYFSYAVDIWAAGLTILSWIDCKESVFTSMDYEKLLRQVASIVGTDQLMNYVEKYGVELKKSAKKSIDMWRKKSIGSLFSQNNARFYSPELEDLIEKTLIVDPEKRITSCLALKSHQYFKNQ